MYERYCVLRDAKRLTDAMVSRGSGVSQSTFSDWKSGRSKPKGEKLKKIADFLGVSVDYLLYGEDDNGYYINKETAQKAQELFENADMRILFDAAKDSKPENLQMAAELLRRLKETNPDG